MSHPLSLTPAGKKRNAAAFIPFFGGRRICFGKTIAEASMKIVVTYMCHYFEMEFVDKEKYPDTHSLPVSQILMSEFAPVEIKLTARRATVASPVDSN